MYNEYLETYFNQYMALSDNKKCKLDNKYDLVNLFLVNTYNYDDWFKNEESIDKEESNMPPLEADEVEVKEGKGSKI